MQYEDYIADEVLELIADGWTLERIGLIDGMPPRTTFLRWRRASVELSTKYEKAIQDRVGLSFDRLSDVAFELLDPTDEKHRGRLNHIDQASKILLKLMGQASAIVQGYTAGEGTKIPHIQVSFVASTEKPPPEAIETKPEEPPK